MLVVLYLLFAIVCFGLGWFMVIGLVHVCYFVGFTVLIVLVSALSVLVFLIVVSYFARCLVICWWNGFGCYFGVSVLGFDG